jgi:hypothetical protein
MNYDPSHAWDRYCEQQDLEEMGKAIEEALADLPVKIVDWSFSSTDFVHAGRRFTIKHPIIDGDIDLAELRKMVEDEIKRV